MTNAGIYVIESPTGDIYVGQSINLRKRFNSYRNLECKQQPGIYNSLKKHTPEKHEFKIIHPLPHDVSREVIDCYEITYIELFKQNGFKVLNISGGGHNGKMAEETKQKLSLSKKGKPRDYFKGELNPYFGKKHSDEVRKRMSASNKGKKSGAKNGRSRSVSQFDLAGTLIDIHSTLTEAAIKVNISRQGISDCVNGRNKTAAGFTWKYNN